MITEAEKLCGCLFTCAGVDSGLCLGDGAIVLTAVIVLAIIRSFIPVGEKP